LTGRAQGGRVRDGSPKAKTVFLQARGQTVELASFDERQIAAARALHIPIFGL
jgi:hypothetical protein